MRTPSRSYGSRARSTGYRSRSSSPPRAFGCSASRGPSIAWARRCPFSSGRRRTFPSATFAPGDDRVERPPARPTCEGCCDTCGFPGRRDAQGTRICHGAGHRRRGGARRPPRREPRHVDVRSRRATVRDARDDQGLRDGGARPRRARPRDPAATALVVYRARRRRRAAVLDARNALARPRRAGARERSRRPRLRVRDRTTSSGKHSWRARCATTGACAVMASRGSGDWRRRSSEPRASSLACSRGSSGRRQSCGWCRATSKVRERCSSRRSRRMPSSATRSRSDGSMPSSARWRTPWATLGPNPVQRDRRRAAVGRGVHPAHLSGQPRRVLRAVRRPRSGAGDRTPGARGTAA